MPRGTGIPDMRFINRELPIVEVARALDLRLDGAGKIHCWHPDRHQHGDRTASVGIRASNNTVKCFGCDSKPMGPIDLAMDVHGLGAADAARGSQNASRCRRYRRASGSLMGTRGVIGSDTSVAWGC